jgi:hypothetical protein
MSMAIRPAVWRLAFRRVPVTRPGLGEALDTQKHPARMREYGAVTPVYRTELHTIFVQVKHTWSEGSV